MPTVKVNFPLTSYTPPGLAVVNFPVSIYAPALDGDDFALAAFTVPPLDAVNFAFGGGPTYYGILKCWAGAAWVKEPLKVYLGSWQSKPLKRWNGTEWKLVDTTGV